MSVFDRVKLLAEKQKISVRKVALDLGLGETYMYTLKKKVPNGANLEKLADYFHVSVDYLLEREEIENTQFSSELLDAIDNAEGYSGKPIDDHDKEIIKNLLAGYFAGKNNK